MPVTVETTQNVTIEYDIASLGERVVASIVDVLVIMAYVYGLITLIGALPFLADLGYALIVLLYLPIFLYDLLCEVFLDGQSFGKKAMRIRVVKLDGSEPTLGSYLL